jgi:hypothetical protein
MAETQVEEVSRQPEVDAVQSHDMEKAYGETVENSTDKEEIVVDADAAGYVNHNIIIDEATNKRLRKMINWRYVSCKNQSFRPADVLTLLKNSALHVGLLYCSSS